MTTSDSTSESIEDGRLAGVGRVVKLTVNREAFAELIVSIRVAVKDSDAVVDLTFYDVRDLHFRRWGMELNTLVGLLVENISSRGWCGLHFAVTDDEEEFVSFECGRIERAVSTDKSVER